MMATKPWVCNSYITISHPIKVGSYTEMAHLVLPSVPDASLDLSMEGQGWMRVGGREDGSVSVVYVSLQGSCEVIRVSCIYMSYVQKPFLASLGSSKIAKKDNFCVQDLVTLNTLLPNVVFKKSY